MAWHGMGEGVVGRKEEGRRKKEGEEEDDSNDTVYIYLLTSLTEFTYLPDDFHTC